MLRQNTLIYNSSFYLYIFLWDIWSWFRSKNTYFSFRSSRKKFVALRSERLGFTLIKSVRKCKKNSSFLKKSHRWRKTLKKLFRLYWVILKNISIFVAFITFSPIHKIHHFSDMIIIICDVTNVIWRNMLSQTKKLANLLYI